MITTPEHVIRPGCVQPQLGISTLCRKVELDLIIFSILYFPISSDCIINVDLEVADQCQYWLEGIILVSFIIFFCVI